MSSVEKVTRSAVIEALKGIGHSVYDKSTDGSIQGIRDHNGTVIPFNVKPDRIEIRTSVDDNYTMCIYFSKASIISEADCITIGTKEQFVQFYHFKG